jgi:ABC-type antimicrobial peptide transport system permease subunit
MRPDSKHRYHAFYATLSQHNSNFRTMLVRTSNNPALYAEQARLEVLAVNRGIPIYHVFTLEDIFIRSVWTRQFFSRLFTASGFVALFLACVGIYGVMTYNVSQRTQELGMRMALGAQPGTVIGMVLGDGFRLLSIGLILGLMGAFFCAQLLESVLYGVSPHDPPTFALVPVLLIAVGLLACYLPTRRVTRIDPNSAIRCE